MTQPNIPLLRKMVEWVEEQEGRTEGREWYQGWWISNRKEVGQDPEFAIDHFCDTAYCVAGKVVVDAGWSPLPGGAEARNGDEVRRVRDIATNLLGLLGDDATALFDGNNRADDIRSIAEDIAGERL